jgi:hypothetical protein
MVFTSIFDYMATGNMAKRRFSGCRNSNLSRIDCFLGREGKRSLKEVMLLYTLKQLKKMFSLSELKTEFKLKNLKTEFILSELKTEFILSELKTEFILSELKTEFSLSELKDEFTLSDLIYVYSLSQLSNHFNLEYLKGFYTIQELSSYYSIINLINSYTILELNSVFSLIILKDYFSFIELNKYFDELTLNSFGIFRPIVKTLFFSKYMEGSSNNKAIEIYNPTDFDINLELYAIPYVINGANRTDLIDLPEGWFFFPDESVIKANSKYLIINPSTTIINPNIADFVPLTSTAYPTGYNGDDGIKLVNFENILDKTNKTNYKIIDTIGTFTKVSPNNSPWAVAGILLATQNKTLIRKPTIVKGNNNWDSSAGTDLINSEWIVYNIDTISSTYPNNVGLPFIYENLSWTFGDSTPIIISNTSITNINGLKHLSSYNNLPVKTSGIITAKSSNGFYIQDGIDNTKGSCGLFIYTGITSSYLISVSIGDLIEITGTILEYGYTNQLTITELSSITKLVIISSNNSLPEPINIGKDYNNVPNLIIDDNNINNFNPNTSALDYWENYENMLVTIQKPKVIGQKKDFGSFAVTIDIDNPNRINTKYGGVLLDKDENPDVLIASNILMYQNPIFYSVYPGDTITNLTGIISYNYGYFNILPRMITDFGLVTKGEIARDLLAVSGTLNSPAYRQNEALPTLQIPHISIASSNQFNLQYKPNESRVADYIRINLKSPQIICFQEIQDDNGEINDGNVSSDNNLNYLISLINDPKYDKYSISKYAYVYVPPENNQDGGAPGANIRVVFIYDIYHFEVQSYKRIGEKNETDAFDNSRKPLYVVVKHKLTNEIYHLIGVHNKSKSGDNSPWGAIQPPVQVTLPQRIKQTTYIRDWIKNNIPYENTIILGDFNDYEWSDSVKILDDNTENRFMKNLVNDILESERYSFYFSGTYHSIDHMIVSSKIYNKIKSVFDTNITIPKKSYIIYSDVLSTQLWIQSLGEPILVDHNPIILRIPL